MRFPCWEGIARTLTGVGCDVVFGLPADDPGLLDAASYVPGLDVRVLGDQRVAACAATGYAMVSGVPAVLALNSGPSFANAIPGLLEAASLSVPVVVVTTRVPSAHIGRGAFQYLEQREMVASLADWHHLVEVPSQVSWAMRRAVECAVTGRPGVVVVELADEVTRHEIDVPEYEPLRLSRTLAPAADLDEAAEVLHSAAKPLVLVGGGARWSDVGGRIGELSELLGAPLFTTAAGRGAVDERRERAFGLVGLYATPPAGDLLGQTDVVLVLGSRLEETARMGWERLNDTYVVQVDAAAQTFGEGCYVDRPLLGDIGLTLDALLLRLRGRPSTRNGRWVEEQQRVATEQQRWTDVDFGHSPVRAMIRCVQRVLDDPGVIVQENGLHDIWSYHYPVLRVGEDTRVVCPGEQTMMGFGVAASVGAAIASRHGPTVVFCGDSAFRLSVGVLSTLREHSLGVVIVIFDNGGFGWPRYLRGSIRVPDGLTRTEHALHIRDIAAAFGGWGCDIKGADEAAETLKEAKERAAHGQFSLIRVATPDSDVPIGVTAS